jgi:VanZ family protein
MRYYLGPMLWMGLMFLFSTDVGSMDNTNAFLAPFIKIFAPEISRKNLVLTLIAIRKLAHVVEYAILSILWLYALKQGKPGWSWRAALNTLAICVVYAGLDEFHQGFVLSRTGSLQDVGIDSFGAILGQALWGFFRGEVSTIQAKFFGWWFAWGVFSAIMVLIVLQGGTLSFWKMLLVIVSAGVLSGAAGVIYYARHR